MKITFLICTLLISLKSIAQKDSLVFCNQYFLAIDYIKQDTFTKTSFKVNECKFKVSNEIKSAVLDNTFKDELMSYILRKENKLADSIMINSLEKEISRYDEAYFRKINCIDSDEKYNLTLNFERVRDTIFVARIYEIEKKSFLWNTNRNEKTFVEYLFIINRRNIIETVFKRKSYEIIQYRKGY